MNDIGSRSWSTPRSLRTATPRPPPRRAAARHQPECQRSAVDAIGGALPCPVEDSAPVRLARGARTGGPEPLQFPSTRATRKHSALVVERTGCDVIGGRAPLRPLSSMLG